MVIVAVNEEWINKSVIHSRLLMGAHPQSMQFRSLEFIALPAGNPLFQIANCVFWSMLGVHRWSSIYVYRRFGAICCHRLHLVQLWFVAVVSKQFGPCHSFKWLNDSSYFFLQSVKIHKQLQREIKTTEKLLNMFSLKNSKLLYLYECSMVIFNPLTPNDHYRGRTAPLTSKVAFYIFIQQI